MKEPEMHVDMLINGQQVAGDRRMPVLNPATELPFATVTTATKDDVDSAVRSAQEAFKTWQNTTIEDRQARLVKWADALASHATSLADLLTEEQGKPVAEAQTEIAWSEGYLRHYATLAPEEHVIQDDDSGFIKLVRKPLGVVAAIVPWNFPILIAIWKLAPAVLAGNTVVLKTAPTTPLTTLTMGHIITDIFPPGVINIITDNNDLGAYLTEHPDIAKIGFTGSSATGRKVMSAASKSLKRLTLELGGNDAAIVLPDVNVEETADKIFQSAFLNCGQVCLAIKRVYVHEDIYSDVCDALAKRAKAAVIGDGREDGVQFGPVQNKTQFDKIQTYLDSIKQKGAILAGGQILDRAGYFVAPTIVADVNDGDSIVDEEQFGPILPIISYADTDDAIQQANASDLGLGASVWSNNVETATDIASRLEAGSCWVNQHINIGPNIPMAGAKSSGLGVEQGVEGLNEYTQIQVINVAR
ncbi:MAG: aldehyde dehydrogenase family protein [Pseudomonadota bacterium]